MRARGTLQRVGSPAGVLREAGASVIRAVRDQQARKPGRFRWIRKIAGLRMQTARPRARKASRAERGCHLFTAERAGGRGPRRDAAEGEGPRRDGAGRNFLYFELQPEIRFPAGYRICVARSRCARRTAARIIFLRRAYNFSTRACRVIEM